MKINSLANVIPSAVVSSLFEDNVLIAYSGHNPDVIERKLQDAVNRIARWAKFNGFRFSPTKTTMMEFFEKREPVRVISLFMNGTVIKKSENAKFLGLTWDAKLNWITHIHNIKSKCAKDLNLMRSVSGSKWGADQETLLRIYRALIRSKIDYGCIVYGSASETALKHLDVVVNDAMRISTGAFKSTPIKNLNILCNEPELKLRRYDLMLRYYFKLKCHLQNPAYSSLIDDRLELYFNSRQYTMKPVIMRCAKLSINTELSPNQFNFT